MARDADVVDEDGGVGCPAEDVRAGRQTDFAIAEKDAARCRRLLICRGPGLGRDLAAEVIAVAMDRPDEARRPGIVTDRVAQLGDEARERPIGHERVNPQTLMNLVFGERARPGIDEQFQQPQQLGSRVDNRSVARQLAPLAVERAVAEHETHGRSRF